MTYDKAPLEKDGITVVVRAAWCWWLCCCHGEGGPRPGERCEAGMCGHVCAVDSCVFGHTLRRPGIGLWYLEGVTSSLDSVLPPLEQCACPRSWDPCCAQWHSPSSRSQALLRARAGRHHSFSASGQSPRMALLWGNRGWAHWLSEATARLRQTWDCPASGTLVIVPPPGVLPHQRLGF